MDWPTLIQNNFGTFIGVGGTLAGYFFGLCTAYLTKRWERQRLLLQWRHEYHVHQFVDPVMAFVDDMLGLMSETYWFAADLITEGKTWDSSQPAAIMRLDKLHSLRQKDVMMKSRVIALEDRQLSHTFDELSNRFGLFSSRIAEGKVLSGAFEEMQEAGKLAGTLFTQLRTVAGSV